MKSSMTSRIVVGPIAAKVQRFRGPIVGSEGRVPNLTPYAPVLGRIRR